MLSCLFLAVLWSPVGSRLISWLYVREVYFCFCHFTIMCSWSSVIFDLPIPDMCLLHLTHMSLLGPQRMLVDLYCFWLVCLSVRGHSNSVIFNWISSKFHILIAFINLSFKFEYGFSPTAGNKDGQQNGRHLSISAVVVILTQSFSIGFLPNFIYEFLLSAFHLSLNMFFFLTSHNLDDRQECRWSSIVFSLSICLSDLQSVRLSMPL